MLADVAGITLALLQFGAAVTLGVLVLCFIVEAVRRRRDRS